MASIQSIIFTENSLLVYMGNFYITKLSFWEDFFNLDRYFLHSFVFRGQSNANWELETSIERAHTNFVGSIKNTCYEIEERWMLSKFMKKYHLYADIPIPRENKFEWLAVLQHYGAPTRLLDFTESFFIALYFATIDSNSDNDSIIWAINKQRLKLNLSEKFGLPYKEAFSVHDDINEKYILFANNFIGREYASFKNSSETTVIPLESMVSSERLVKQQGLFLMPTNSQLSFMDNLTCCFKQNIEFKSCLFDEMVVKSVQEPIDTEIDIIKIIIPQNMRIDIAVFLKEMNITAETLFPGLDGLAKSLIHTEIISK